MKNKFMNKKGDIPFWLISLIIVLVTLVVLIFIISGVGSEIFSGLDFIADLF